jgi:lysophospholipase L1-like esterase
VVRESGASASDDTVTLYGKLAPYRLTVLRELFRRFKAEADRRHAPVIAILVPSVETGELSKRRVADIRELLDAAKIPAVDVLDTFDDVLDTAQLAAYRGDVHPNARGHAMIYRNLYDKLKAQPEAWNAVTGPR